jgi:hypothetical protein
MDIFLKHQLKIAAQTLRLTDEGAHIVGGMTKEEARQLLTKHRPARKPRKGGRR